MTEPVFCTCERCGVLGERVPGHVVSPNGWFFGRFKLDEDGDHDPGDFLVVHVCSVECRDALWTLADGQTWQDIADGVHDPAEELRRAARKQIERLERDLERVTIGAGACSIGSKFADVLRGAIDAIEIETEHQIEWMSEGHP